MLCCYSYCCPCSITLTLLKAIKAEDLIMWKVFKGIRSPLASWRMVTGTTATISISRILYRMVSLTKQKGLKAESKRFRDFILTRAVLFYSMLRDVRMKAQPRSAR